MSSQPITAPAQWPEALRRDFESNQFDGHVGSRLVSETERVRVWILTLRPGERIGFHRHVLDYFWTCLSNGTARSNYANGRAQQVTYEPGDTQHHSYGPGECMIHDLENVGSTDLTFTTVEFLDSSNAPLPL